MMKASTFAIQKKISAYALSGLDFILPPRCAGCGVKISAHGFVCSACWGELQPLSAPYCTKCSIPFEFETEGESQCAACMVSVPEFDWARAAVLYEEMGKRLVLRLKHSGTNAVVPVMAQMMATAVHNCDVDMIVPVPLHSKRFVSRRFNQSQLLAKQLAVHLNVPVDNFVLIKKRATASQGGLNRKERFKNVTGVFAVEKGRIETLKGKHILLVDDVLTTGATAGACAKVLKKAGASEVGLAVFARVGQPVKG